MSVFLSLFRYSHVTKPVLTVNRKLREFTEFKKFRTRWLATTEWNQAAIKNGGRSLRCRGNWFHKAAHVLFKIEYYYFFYFSFLPSKFFSQNNITLYTKAMKLYGPSSLLVLFLFQIYHFINFFHYQCYIMMKSGNEDIIWTSLLSLSNMYLMTAYGIKQFVIYLDEIE